MFGERERIQKNGYETPVGCTQRVRQNNHSTGPVFDIVQMGRRLHGSRKAKSSTSSAGIKKPQKTAFRKSDDASVNRNRINAIGRICNNHGWKIDDVVAASYLKQMEEGLQPRIQNHNAVIIPAGKSFRIIKRRFSGSGTMGRTLDSGGADAVIDHGASPYQPPEQYTSEAVIRHKSLTDISKRASLNTVMDGSAYERTGIVNSEHLHRIAHSMGGSDTADNLTPGYHALNTAMIPIENFVRDLAAKKMDVSYNVQFFPRPGNDIWTGEAHMTVAFKWDGKDHKYEWHVALDSSKLLSQKSYDQIVREIKGIKKELEL